MAAPQRSFLTILVAFTLACVAGLALTARALRLPWDPVFLGMPLYFAVLTFLLHRWQEKALAGDPKGFVQRFMTALVVKMFASVAVLVLLLLTTAERFITPMALGFAVLYLAYVVFSTIRLMRLSQHAGRP